MFSIEKRLSLLDDSTEGALSKPEMECIFYFRFAMNNFDKYIKFVIDSLIFKYVLCHRHTDAHKRTQIYNKCIRISLTVVHSQYKKISHIIGRVL